MYSMHCSRCKYIFNYFQITLILAQIKKATILMDSVFLVVMLWMIILCICTGDATCVTDLFNIQW